MRTINLLSTATSICLLVLLLVHLYTNEFFAGSILFWILSIGSLLTALIGVFTGARCE